MINPLKLTNTLVFGLCAWLAASVPALAADPVKTLRSADVVDSDRAPEELKQLGKRPGTQKPIARTFDKQPPLIPHATENFDEVNLEENQCLSCHGPEKFKEKKAPKIGDSHFIDREGNKLPGSDTRRYNCTSCHAPQFDAPPLVDNQFKGTPPAAAKKK